MQLSTPDMGISLLAVWMITASSIFAGYFDNIEILAAIGLGNAIGIILFNTV